MYEAVHGAPLGRKLREARRARSIKQQQVADYLGIERSTYSYYETGKSLPPIPALYKLSKLFDISADELIKPDLVSTDGLSA